MGGKPGPIFMRPGENNLQEAVDAVSHEERTMSFNSLCIWFIPTNTLIDLKRHHITRGIDSIRDDL